MKGLILMDNLKLCAFADEYNAALDRQIEGLQKNDISLLEIRGVDGVNISNITKKQAEEIKNKLDSADIKVWSIGSPFGKIKISDSFDEHLDLFERCVENALVLGAQCIRIFSFFTEEFTPAVRDEVFYRLSRFVEKAQGSGLVLCHENEKGIYGDIAVRCEEILKSVPSLKAVFDPANFIQCGQPTLPAFEMLKKYTYYLHIKDALSNGEVVPAGCGEGHLDQIIKEWNGMGGGVLTLEPHLKVFAGLEELEGGHKSVVSDYSYPTNEEAFCAACDAVKKIIDKI